MGGEYYYMPFREESHISSCLDIMYIVFWVDCGVCVCVTDIGESTTILLVIPCECSGSVADCGYMENSAQYLYGN